MVLYKEGDLVWLTKDIFSGGNDCSPSGYVGRKGDYMRVTGISPYTPLMVYIVHKDYTGDGGICAYPHEISSECPLLTIAERKEYVAQYGLDRCGLTEEDLRVIKWEKPLVKA